MKHLKYFLAVAALATATTLAGCGAPTAPDFVKQAAISDMYEVEAGKIASQKGQSEQVKKFGQQMVEAHTKTSEEVKAIVQSENIKVALPTALDSKHQALIDDLNKAKPEDFDKTYANQQVDAHKDAVSLFEKYSKNGDNGALKAFAAKTLPVIQQHLEMAKQLTEKAPPVG